MQILDVERLVRQKIDRYIQYHVVFYTHYGEKTKDVWENISDYYYHFLCYHNKTKHLWFPTRTFSPPYGRRVGLIFYGTL